MSIRAKLAWTFILLLIFGITAISSYSILFIRNYLLNEGEKKILNDTEWLSITIQNLDEDAEFETNLNEAARTSGYQISIYDSEGRLFASVPYHESVDAEKRLRTDFFESLSDQNEIILVDNEGEKLIAYSAMSATTNPARYLRVGIFKDQIYEPIKTIRWIIYTGMFISIGLVLVVSIWFARYISKPIIQLEAAARDISDGNVNRTLNLERNDEFGTLADSLNKMAKRLLADSNKMKKLYERQSQFFADITHELRNPLHTITGSLEMLEMDDLDQKQKERYLKTAVRQTERIGRLFKDLMTLQRYDSDNYFVEKKPFHLRTVLNRISSTYKPIAESKGIAFNVESSDAEIYGDPDKIEQVFENLVSNAIKYTNQGKIEIKLDESEDQVWVEVVDTGVGISKEHLDRLFDRFYRTDHARSRDKGGTGLGLAVVKSILNAHSSEIEVESEPGVGSLFRFNFIKSTGTA